MGRGVAYTPDGLARYNANKPGKGPRQIPPANGNDPLGESNPPGLYRTLVYNRPFEFIQTKEKVTQLFEWAKIWRNIWTDGRPVPEDVPAGPYWYGYSVGKWDGDTLVVTTLGLDDRAWMDEWGTPFSSEARFTERWKKTGPDRIELTITVSDPTTFTKPWTSAPIAFSRQKEEVLEMIFAPIDEKVGAWPPKSPAALRAAHLYLNALIIGCYDETGLRFAAKTCNGFSHPRPFAQGGVYRR